MINKYILGLKISMEYSFRMNIGNSIEYFLKNNLDFILVRFILLAYDKFLKVVVIVIKYNFKQLIFRFIHNIDKRYNIGMFFECFE